MPLKSCRARRAKIAHMSSNPQEPKFTDEQLASAAEMAKRASALLPTLLEGLEQATAKPSPEFQEFQRELDERNRRGARRTSGRIV